LKNSSKIEKFIKNSKKIEKIEKKRYFQSVKGARSPGSFLGRLIWSYMIGRGEWEEYYEYKEFFAFIP
jgi:hypothetical protein